MPDQMRQIFAYLIIYFDISEARELFRDFAPQLCEDFFTRTLDTTLSIRLGLIRICQILQDHGYDYRQFIDENINFEELESYHRVVHEIVPDPRNIVALNDEQRLIFEVIAETIENRSNTNLGKSPLSARSNFEIRYVSFDIL